MLLLALPSAAVLAQPSVRVLHAPADSLLARQIRREAEEALASWEGPLGSSPLKIILARDGNEFRREAGGRNPEWAAALVLEPGRTLLLDKSRFYQIADRRAILRHEVGHIVLDRTLPRSRLPHWFHEGFAQLFAARWEERDAWLLGRAAWFGGAIPLGELRGRFPVGGPRAKLAYAESQAAVNWLWRRPEAWRRLLAEIGRGPTLERSIPRIYDLAGLDYESYFDAKILRSYRNLGLLYGGGPLLSLGLLLFLWAGWRRRRRLRDDGSRDGDLDYEAAWLDRQRLERGLPPPRKTGTGRRRNRRPGGPTIH